MKVHSKTLKFSTFHHINTQHSIWIRFQPSTIKKKLFFFSANFQILVQNYSLEFKQCNKTINNTIYISNIKKIGSAEIFSVSSISIIIWKREKNVIITLYIYMLTIEKYYLLKLGEKSGFRYSECIINRFMKIPSK